MGLEDDGCFLLKIVPFSGNIFIFGGSWYPIGSMLWYIYIIFTNIDHKNQPNVGNFLLNPITVSVNIPPTHPWFFQKPPDPCGIQGHQRIAWIHLLPPMGEIKSWTVPVAMIVIKSKHQNLNETNIHFHSIQHNSNKTKYHPTFVWLFESVSCVPYNDCFFTRPGTLCSWKQARCPCRSISRFATANISRGPKLSNISNLREKVRK